MAMTPTLFSISGLATELGRDRRTVAAALAEVPPDGEVAGGHKAWRLTTALTALERREDDDQLIGGGVSEVFESALHALRNPEHRKQFRGRIEHRGEPGAEVWDGSIEEIAAIEGVEPETVLHWLRAGCPYLVEGDWSTGEGFVVRWVWLADWRRPLEAIAKATGRWDVAAELRL